MDEMDLASERRVLIYYFRPFFAWRDDFFSSGVKRREAPVSRLQAEVWGVENAIAATHRSTCSLQPAANLGCGRSPRYG